VEARQLAATDHARDLVVGALPRHFQLLAAARGLDLAAFAHFILARGRLQAALQCMVGRNEGVVAGVRVLVHGPDRALQQAQPLRIEVVLAQPARAGQRDRIQQHARRVRAIDEEAVVAQGQLQQRQFQALDQCLARTAAAQFALQLGQEQAEQFEAIAVGLGERHAVPVHLPRLRQQRLPDVGQVAVLGGVAAHAP